MSKLNNFIQAMHNIGIEQAVITSPQNIFYLIGHSPNQLSVSNNNNIALLYISKEKTILLTMDYEAPFIKDNVGVEVISYSTWTGLQSLQAMQTDKKVVTSTIWDKLSTLLKPITVGLELNAISHQTLSNFTNYSDISELLLNQRMIKTEKEVEIFTKLCNIQVNALKNMAENIKIGTTEKNLIEVYRNNVFNSNYCVPSAWTMLGSGVNSAYLATPTNKLIQDGDVIKFDGGVNLEYNYYTTDMSRSFLVGNVNSTLKEIKKILVAAQKQMINAIKPGIKCSELYNIGYNYVKQFFPGYTRGHLGHSISVGPSTFEKPFIAPNDDTVLVENMILCIEVPMYIENLGGFNIEDMILVTKTGVKVLTEGIDHYYYENLHK